MFVIRTGWPQAVKDGRNCTPSGHVALNAGTARELPLSGSGMGPPGWSAARELVRQACGGSMDVCGLGGCSESQRKCGVYGRGSMRMLRFG